MVHRMIAVLVLALMAVACTDAERSRYGALGSAVDVTCYSGGKAVYEGASTGKIISPENSDGWQFREAGPRGRLVEVSGTCIMKVQQ